MEKKYLPIGSVCTIKGKTKKIMIIGYYYAQFNGNLKINDYVGCAYPEGMLLPEFYCSFNHSDIENVDFIGFKNEEQSVFDSLLDRLSENETSDVKEAIDFHKDNEMFFTSNSTYSKLLFDENGVVMIADKIEKKSNTWNNIEFDKNGYVISAQNSEDIKNPFYKEYEEPKENLEKNTKDWNIFKEIEFDKDGNVISATTNIEEPKESLNKLEFDENGTLVSMGTNNLEEVPPVGPGLPGYVEPKNKKTSNYKFDSEGKVVAENTYEFDVNGNLVSMDIKEMKEEVPPVGPGLPGYVEPKNKKTSNYKFDSEGKVVAENTYEFDASGNLVSIDTQKFKEDSTDLETE